MPSKEWHRDQHIKLALTVGQLRRSRRHLAAALVGVIAASLLFALSVGAGDAGATTFTPAFQPTCSVQQNSTTYASGATTIPWAIECTNVPPNIYNLIGLVTTSGISTSANDPVTFEVSVGFRSSLPNSFELYCDATCISGTLPTPFTAAELFDWGTTTSIISSCSLSLPGMCLFPSAGGATVATCSNPNSDTDNCGYVYYTVEPPLYDGSTNLPGFSQLWLVVLGGGFIIGAFYSLVTKWWTRR